MVINFHYCYEKLARISFLTFGGKQGCECNPQDVPKDCCKDELKCQKSDNHRTIQPAQVAEYISFAIETPPSNNYFTIPLSDKDDPTLFTNEEQRSCPEPIYLLNKVFRI